MLPSAPVLLTPIAVPGATPSISSRTAGSWLAGTAIAGVLGLSPAALIPGASLLPVCAPLSGARSERRGCFWAVAGFGTVGSRPAVEAARLAPAAADRGSRPEAARDIDSADCIGSRPDGALCMSADAGSRLDPLSRWWPSAATNTMPARHEVRGCSC